VQFCSCYDLFTGSQILLDISHYFSPTISADVMTRRAQLLSPT
jgi:hypothetical protein